MNRPAAPTRRDRGRSVEGEGGGVNTSGARGTEGAGGMGSERRGERGLGGPG